MSNYWSNVGSARDTSPSSNERIKTDETVSPGFYLHAYDGRVARLRPNRRVL